MQRNCRPPQRPPLQSPPLRLSIGPLDDQPGYPSLNVSSLQVDNIKLIAWRFISDLVCSLIFAAASRSTSPSSRNVYGANYQSAYRQTGTIPKKPGIPRSLANSRETSPTRNQTVRRLGYMPSTIRRPDRPPINPTRPVLAQKMLQASREAENALADALVSAEEFGKPLHWYRHV